VSTPENEALLEEAIAHVNAGDIEQGRAKLERVLLRDTEQGAVVIPAREIEYLEAEGDRVRIFVGSDSYLKDKSLPELEAGLDEELFVRIHDSFIVNIRRISRIEERDRGSEAVLSNGTRLPLSRKGLAEIRNRLG